MTFNEFKSKWDGIPAHGNGFLRLGIDHPLDLEIGYATSEYKSFIVMDSGIVSEIPSSFAVKAINTELRNHTYILEFQLIHPAFEDIFLHLCWDMIETSIDSQNPVSDLTKRYISWQKFLQYTSTQVLSYERQKGLLGELLYLRSIMTEGQEEWAINAWNGSEGCDQDFLFEKTWAEIKTIALGSKAVKISSLEQLNQEQDGLLVVYVLEKSSESPDHVCLPDVVLEIKEKLKNSPRILDRFEMKLFRYGYRNKDENEYKANYFRLVEHREYNVKESFPKLTRNNTASEIIACEYEISLAAIEKYRRD